MAETTEDKIGIFNLPPELEIKIEDPALDSSSVDNSFTVLGKQSKARFTDSTLNVDYVIVHHYENDMHRYMMGITVPNAGVGIVQLCAETLMWICDWTAASFIKQPIIPDHVPQTIGKWALLGKQFSLPAIITGPDGETPQYRISGTYIYACLSPSSSVFSDLVFPIGAWLQNVFDRSVPLDKVEKGLTDSNQQSSQGGGGQSQGGAAGQYTRG